MTTNPDGCGYDRGFGTEINRLAERGDVNIVFVPRTDSRYHEYAPTSCPSYGGVLCVDTRGFLYEHRVARNGYRSPIPGILM